MVVIYHVCSGLLCLGVKEQPGMEALQGNGRSELEAGLLLGGVFWS